MKMNFTSKILGLMLFATAVSFGQTDRQVFGQPIEKINPNNGMIRCVSSEYEKSLQAADANRRSHEAFEQWIAPKVAEAKARLLSGRSVNEVITIPVVVHVIHNGDAIGSNENISNARVLSQITVLNQDFRRMLGTPGYNDSEVGADVEIEFCMAQRKPDGTATNGIDRVNLGVTSWSTDAQVEGNLKPNTIWDPTQYFNIWVCSFSASGDLGGILGYAQFPYGSGLTGLGVGSGVFDTAETDGVIIDYRCFGTSDIAPSANYFLDYDKGRTATHEVGHCLGLIHIWGDTPSCTGLKDYCADTPSASIENYDCMDAYDSCPSAAGIDMTENYMDYTNDTCMNIFTLDQKARMIAVMNNANRRASLKTSIACTAPLAVPGVGLFEGIKLFPNPASDYIAISMGDANELPESYVIYNALGQVVSQKTVSTGADLTISTSALSNGVYFIKLAKDGAFKTMQFVKQ
jgi:hypothetical protein